MGHSGEGHRKFVQKNEGTTYSSIIQGMRYSTVPKSLGLEPGCLEATLSAALLAVTCGELSTVRINEYVT